MHVIIQPIVSLDAVGHISHERKIAFRGRNIYNIQKLKNNQHMPTVRKVAEFYRRIAVKSRIEQ